MEQLTSKPDVEMSKYDHTDFEIGAQKSSYSHCVIRNFVGYVQHHDAPWYKKKKV